ncbi:MAG: type II secretion system protein [Planctomycetes bacterium]|nr:type II secretion system protein [Planctomycetota bacterium]
MTRNRRGMTLLEVLLAVGVMGLVGAGVTSMMSALTVGMAQQHDARTSVLRASLAQARLSSYLTRARCLLDLEPTRLVLWLEDADGDDVIDGTEVRWLNWESGRGALRIAWLVDSEGVAIEDPYSDPAGIDWWSEFDTLRALSGVRDLHIDLVSGLDSWAFTAPMLGSARVRREAAMNTRTIDAAYELDVSGVLVQHCLGDSVRLHDPPEESEP